MRIFLNRLALLLFTASIITLVSCSDDDPISPQEEHFEPEGWVFVDATGTRFMTIWQGKFDTGSATTMTAPLNELTDHIEVKFLDENKKEIDAPDDEHYTFSYIIADTNLLELYQHEAGEFEFHLKGKAAGTTEIEFYVLHEGHIDVRTIKIPVEIK